MDAGVSYLNQARARLGRPRYTLPADFASLSPARQVFILTNEDRILYGLPPIQGLTNSLNQDAAGGMRSDSDPVPSDRNWSAFTANWSGGDDNIVLAYEGWMYDDGPGSGNLDCTSAGLPDCWGHRHDILWHFDGSGPLGMGAAAGMDSSRQASYTMLIEKGFPGVRLVYTYTWSQAVADDASGRGATTVSSRLRIERARVRGHRIMITILAPTGTVLRCSLTGRNTHGKRIRRSERCGRSAVFKHVPTGHYRLRVASGAATAKRRVIVG